MYTMIFSGDCFSGHYGISKYYEEYERWKTIMLIYIATVPTDEQHPDDIEALSGLVNLLFCCFGFLYLLLNLSGSSFGCLEILH